MTDATDDDPEIRVMRDGTVDEIASYFTEGPYALRLVLDRDTVLTEDIFPADGLLAIETRGFRVTLPRAVPFVIEALIGTTIYVRREKRGT